MSLRILSASNQPMDWTFWMGKELRCNLMLWLSRVNRLLVTIEITCSSFPPSANSHPNHNSFLLIHYISGKKNYCHYQGNFLLVSFNQIPAWTDLSEPPWGKCKHKDGARQCKKSRPGRRNRSKRLIDVARAISQKHSPKSETQVYHRMLHWLHSVGIQSSG